MPNLPAIPPRDIPALPPPSPPVEQVVNTVRAAKPPSPPVSSKHGAAQLATPVVVVFTNRDTFERTPRFSGQFVTLEAIKPAPSRLIHSRRLNTDGTVDFSTEDPIDQTFSVFSAGSMGFEPGLSQQSLTTVRAGAQATIPVWRGGANATFALSAGADNTGKGVPFGRFDVILATPSTSGQITLKQPLGAAQPAYGELSLTQNLGGPVDVSLTLSKDLARGAETSGQVCLGWAAIDNDNTTLTLQGCGFAAKQPGGGWVVDPHPAGLITFTTKF
jgi:hypothetical protein